MEMGETNVQIIRRTCPVCAHDSYKYWFRPSQSPCPIYRCNSCGFVYVNPIEKMNDLIQEGPVLGDRPATLLESSNIEDIQGSWEQPMIESYIRELPAKKVNAYEVLGHINSLTRGSGTLLDFGCFCGVFLSVASKAGWDCYGIEPLVAPAIYARANFGFAGYY